MKRSRFSIVLSMLLSMLMILGVVPFSALAVGGTSRTDSAPNYSEFRGKGMSADKKTGVMIYDDLVAYYKRSQSNVALSTDYKTSTVNLSTGKNLSVKAEYKECPDLYVDWAIYFDDDIEGNTVIIKYGLSMMDSVQYVDANGVITEGNSPISLTASYGSEAYNAGYEEVKTAAGKTRYTTRYYEEKGIIFYILNHSAGERIGGEDDVSILFDYIDQGYVVVTLDFKCAENAKSPYIEQSLVSARSLFNSYSNAALRDLGVKTSGDYIYFLPEGYRLERDVWYWDTSIWGVNGTMEKYLDTWNTKIAGTSYDPLKIGKVANVEELIAKVTQKDGETPIEYKLSMNIVYPSQPIDGYEAPVYIQEGTNYTREQNIETSYTRGAYTGFALNGYACVQYDHPYWPFLYRSEYSFDGSGGNYGMFQSSENNARAAVRCARYYADELGYSRDLVGAAGISKATPGLSVLCVKNNKQIPQLPISGYDSSIYEGDIVERGRVVNAIVQPFMYYDETNTEEISSDCTVAYISSGGGIERLFGTGSYASYEKVPLVISGGTRDEYNCYNYWDEMVQWLTDNETKPFLPIVQLDQGHTFPVGYDNQFGYERFTAMIKFFDVYLKPDQNRAPEVLWVTPISGSENVPTSGEWVVGPYTPYGWDVDSYYYGQSIRIKFVDAVDPESVNRGVFLMTEGGVPVEGEWVASEGNTLFTYRHNGLVAGMKYVIDITEDVRGQNGVKLDAPRKVTFKTEGTYAVKPVAEVTLSYSKPTAICNAGDILTVSNDKMTLLTFDTRTLADAEAVSLKAKGNAESTVKLAVYALPNYAVDSSALTYGALLNSSAWEDKALVGRFSADDYLSLDLSDLLKLGDLGEYVTLALVSEDVLSSANPYTFTLDFETPVLGTELIGSDGVVAVKKDGTALDAGTSGVTINKPSSVSYLWRRTGAMSDGRIIKDASISDSQIFRVQTKPGEGQFIKFYNTVTDGYMTAADAGKRFRVTFDIYTSRGIDLQVGFCSASGGDGTAASPTSGAFSFFGETHAERVEANKWTTVSCVLTISEDMVNRQAGMASLKLLYPTEDAGYRAYTYIDNLVVEECTPALNMPASSVDQGASYTLVTTNRGMAPNADIKVRFDEAMDADTMTDGVTVMNLFTGDRVKGTWRQTDAEGHEFVFETACLSADCMYAVNTTAQAKTKKGTPCAAETVCTLATSGDYAVKPIVTSVISSGEATKHFGLDTDPTFGGDVLGVLTFSTKTAKSAMEQATLYFDFATDEEISAEIFLLGNYMPDQTLCYQSLASKLTAVTSMGVYKLSGGKAAIDLSVLSRLTLGDYVTLVIKSTGAVATVDKESVMLVTENGSDVVLTENDRPAVEAVYDIAKLTAAQVTVGKSVEMRLYAALSSTMSEATLRVTVNGKQTILKGSRRGGEYVFLFAGLTAADMKSEIKLELMLGDRVLSEKSGYSLEANFRNLLAKSAESLGVSEEKATAIKALLNDLLENGISMAVLRRHSVK